MFGLLNAVAGAVWAQRTAEESGGTDATAAHEMASEMANQRRRGSDSGAMWWGGAAGWTGRHLTEGR